MTSLCELSTTDSGKKSINSVKTTIKPPSGARTQVPRIQMVVSFEWTRSPPRSAGGEWMSDSLELHRKLCLLELACLSLSFLIRLSAAVRKFFLDAAPWQEQLLVWFAQIPETHIKHLSHNTQNKRRWSRTRFPNFSPAQPEICAKTLASHTSRWTATNTTHPFSPVNLWTRF